MYIAHHLTVLRINGWRKASAGVHLFSGLSARQRSNRSANRFNSFISDSFKSFDADWSRVRRSREGLLKERVFTISCTERIGSAGYLNEENAYA
jgi:hypothetical protein